MAEKFAAARSEDAVSHASATRRAERLDPQQAAPRVSWPVGASGVPAEIVRARMLYFQRTAGNKAARTLLAPTATTVQRAGPSLAGMKRAVGLRKKDRPSIGPLTEEESANKLSQEANAESLKRGKSILREQKADKRWTKKLPKNAPTAIKKAQEAAANARTANIKTTSELKRHITALESATHELRRWLFAKPVVLGHGTADQYGVALELKLAAQQILSNLPDQESKASKVLGRTYPEEANRLRKLIQENESLVNERSYIPKFTLG